MDKGYMLKMSDSGKDVEEVVKKDILPSIGKGNNFFSEILWSFLILGIYTNYGIPDESIWNNDNYGFSPLSSPDCRKRWSILYMLLLTFFFKYCLLL